mgnify:FL=1
MSDDQSDQPSDDNQEDIEELLEQFKSSDDSPVEDASTPKKTASGDSALTDSTSGSEHASQNRQENLEPGTLPPRSADFSEVEVSEENNPASVATKDFDYLLNQTREALESIDSPPGDQLKGFAEFKLEEFPGSPPSTEHATLDLLRDVELDLKIELGRTQMHLDEVLRLKRGSVVSLDKLAGDPVDVYVNGRLVARGEVLVLNDNFCVRVAELISGNDVN